MLQAIARHFGYEVESMPGGLMVGVRSALLVGMRPLLDELARLMDPQMFGAPTPSQRPTRPPPPGYDPEVTPIPELEEGVLTGDIRRLLGPRPTGKTLSSHPPPPPLHQRPTVNLKPPPIPDVLSKHLRDKDKYPPKKGGRY